MCASRRLHLLAKGWKRSKINREKTILGKFENCLGKSQAVRARLRSDKKTTTTPTRACSLRAAPATTSKDSTRATSTTSGRVWFVHERDESRKPKTIRASFSAEHSQTPARKSREKSTEKINSNNDYAALIPLLLNRQEPPLPTGAECVSRAGSHPLLAQS